MAPRVYVETTVISYLTARLSRNVVYRGHQHITREWWDDRRQNFEVFVSAVVIEEASRGDAAAALSEAAFVLEEGDVEEVHGEELRDFFRRGNA